MRRAFRRAMRQGPSQDIPPMLRQAHQMMAAGNYAGAADAFEQLGRAAEARGGPRAGNFYLQAGRAHIMAGQKQIGLDNLKRGLEYMHHMGRHGRLYRAGNRVVNELNQNGMTTESQEIADWLKTVLPAGAAGMVAPAAGPAKKPALPTHCPGCGGPVRADEVEWLDEVTAECNWCGGPVRAEG